MVSSFQLNLSEITSLATALLSAFPERTALNSLTLKHLGNTLDYYIPANSGLDVGGPDLVRAAIAKGCVEQLIGGALLQNPGNLELSGFIKKLPSEARSAYPKRRQDAVPRNSSPSEVDSIAKLLSACPCMTETGESSIPYRLFIRLPLDIAQELAQKYAKKQTFNWSQELAKIFACWQGGLQLLTAIVVEQDGALSKVRELDDFITEILPRRQSELSLVELTQNALGITISNEGLNAVLRLFELPLRSLELTWQTGAQTKILPAVIRCLAEAGGTKDFLSEFYTGLKSYAASEAAAAPPNQDANNPGSSNPGIITAATVTGSALSYLLVVIAPSCEVADKYTTKIWSVNQSGQAHNLFDDGTARDIDEIGAAIVDIRKRIAACKCANLDNLQVEFIVPRNLLCCQIEHWQWKVGRRNEKLGVLHPAVLRSFERAYDQELDDTRDSWQSKWRLLQDPAQLSQDSIVWAPAVEPADQKNTLSARLMRREVVCLALTSPPLGVPDNALTDAIETSFDAGVPAVVWLHETTALQRSESEAGQSAEVEAMQARQQQLREELTQQDIRELPNWAHERRRDAAERPAQKGIGSNLKVLWDAPDRPPPDACIQRESIGKRSTK